VIEHDFRITMRQKTYVNDSTNFIDSRYESTETARRFTHWPWGPPRRSSSPL